MNLQLRYVPVALVPNRGSDLIEKTITLTQKQSDKRVTFYHKNNFTIFKGNEQLEKGKRKKKHEKIKDFALLDDD